MIHQLIASLAAAFVVLCPGLAAAQGTSPPPPQAAPRANTPPFPSGGAAPMFVPPSPSGAARDVCLKGFGPLRDEAERRGRLVKAASERKAPREEACKLVTSYAEAEIRLNSFVQVNAAKCAIPQQLVGQIMARREQTEALRKKICDAALVS